MRRETTLFFVLLLTGCPNILTWQQGDEGEQTSVPLDAFNLISITADDSVSTSSQLGLVRFEWGAAGTQDDGAITYTICQKDTSQERNCAALGSVVDDLSLDVDLVGALNAVSNQYFVMASRSGGVQDSNEISIETTEANKLIGYFKASNTGASDQFGNVLALSGDGSTLAVGAQEEESMATGINGDETDNSKVKAGAVYLYRKANGAWTKQAYIKPNVIDGGDKFGKAVAISSDGNTLAVGAPEENSNASGINGDATNNDISNAGAVYIFRYQANAWSQQAYIKPSAPYELYQFGGHIALSADGNVAAVCSQGDDSNATGINGNENDISGSHSGAMHVFRFNGASWSQEAYIKASNTGDEDRFCSSVAISGDGNTVVAGAPFEDSDAAGINGAQGNDAHPFSGAVYVFGYSAGAWSQHAYIKASNSGNGDQFGRDVATDESGSVIVVAAPREDSDGVGVDATQSNNNADNRGAVYVFRLNGGSWEQESYIKLENPSDFDQLYAVSLSSDGNVLAVTSEGDSNAIGIDGDQTDSSATDAGAVHVYKYENSTWTFKHYLKATNTESNDAFGLDHTMNQDGTMIAIGASTEDSSAINLNGDGSDNGAVDSGAVYVF